MEPIVQAMDHYFEKLIAFWKEQNSLPLYPWSEKDDQALFVSPPNEDEEAEWKPAVSEIPKNLPQLCPELRSFFGCRRFWRMAGCLNHCDYTFTPLPTDEAAVHAAEAALKNGAYYLNEDYALIAGVVCKGNDDLVLLYNMHTGALALLDIDREITKPLDISLPELIDRMEVLI